MSNFFHNLSVRDRDVLRRVVQVVHMKHYPKDFVTSHEADKIIAVIGPDVAQKMIKVGIDQKIMEK